MNLDDIEIRVWLWAAIGSPNEPPGRVEVLVCPVCAAVITASGEALHAAHHARGATT